MIKMLYIIAIGVLFAAVIGLGIQAFYPQPKFPEYPTELQLQSSGEFTAEQKAAQKSYDEKSKQFQKTFETYNRNVSLVIIVIALVVLAASILGLGSIEVIGDGITLGGVFTLLYGLGRALAGGDDKVRFVAVTFGLVVLAFLAYWKFIRGTTPALPKNGSN